MYTDINSSIQQLLIQYYYRLSHAESIAIVFVYTKQRYQLFSLV